VVSLVLLSYGVPIVIISGIALAFYGPHLQAGIGRRRQTVNCQLDIVSPTFEQRHVHDVLCGDRTVSTGRSEGCQNRASERVAAEGRRPSRSEADMTGARV
jgi:hypothetical protein